jgi:HSP20 family protein
MTGWIPAEELRKLQKRMNRLIEELGLDDLVEKKEEEYGVIKPLADIHETDEAIVVTMDMPGVDKKDVDITIQEDELRVVAERKRETEVSLKDYHKRERTYKRFERRVLLPASVKMDEAKARLAEGVLEVTLPKVVVVPRKRINID